jgi:multidrug efflux pump subunit AcrA (membrane-fusion protein)
MSAVTTSLPAKRADLVIRPIGDAGRYVVKDPLTAEFFQIGEEEHFLLQQLDGERDAEAICAAFEERFGEPLSGVDLDGFLEMAAKQGLIAKAEGGRRKAEDAHPESDPDAASVRVTPRPKKKRQSILYWRKNIFDPDRLFDRLEPRIRFFWTRGFLVLSALCIAAGIWLLATSPQNLLNSLRGAARWETLVVAWVVLLLVTTLHEFAHGLTCKHYGGEVREIGFLLMFFMPCFYCNVSDAWLFREKSKRLWVTFAGGYFELFVWSLAVFAWRLTLPGSLINYLSFIVVAACGVQSLFNFNPLIKLDGYYLLSDWMEIPNLRQRSWDRVKAHARRLLWGGPRPDADERGRFLTGFGLVSWTFSIVFLGAMLVAMGVYAGNWLGPPGLFAVGLLGVISTRGVFHGFSNGELTTMIRRRHIRTVLWLAAIGGTIAGLCYIEIENRPGAPFHLRSTVRCELRAPAGCFLREVRVAEGETVSPGAVVLRLEIPELDSRLKRKRAELAEATAKLQQLDAGTRPEELAAQRKRVNEAQRLRDHARSDVKRQRQALDNELVAFDRQIARHRAELDAAEDNFARVTTALKQGAVNESDVKEADRRYKAAKAQLEQTRAEKRSRAASATIVVEADLARRGKELADAGIALKLLEAGSRREEIDAQRAAVARLSEELRYLEDLQQKTELVTGVRGVVTTPKLREQVGRYFEQGALICLIEDPASLEAELKLDEQSARRVAAGQDVTLKFRSLPLESFPATVRHIAPSADPSEVNSTLTVYCDPDARSDRVAGRSQGKLRGGLSGYARISTGRRSIGTVMLDRLLRSLRTEYWW